MVSLDRLFDSGHLWTGLCTHECLTVDKEMPEKTIKAWIPFFTLNLHRIHQCRESGNVSKLQSERIVPVYRHLNTLAVAVAPLKFQG